MTNHIRKGLNALWIIAPTQACDASRSACFCRESSVNTLFDFEELEGVMRKNYKLRTCGFLVAVSVFNETMQRKYLPLEWEWLASSRSPRLFCAVFLFCLSWSFDL